MNNSLSLLMLGAMLTICIFFMWKVRSEPTPKKKSQTGINIALIGSTLGLFIGMLIGARKPRIVFSDSFLKNEGAELGAVFLLSLIFGVIGAIGSLFVYGFFKKKEGPDN